MKKISYSSTVQQKNTNNKNALAYGIRVHKLLAEYLVNNPKLRDIKNSKLASNFIEDIIIDAKNSLKIKGVCYLDKTPLVEFYVTNSWLHGYIDLVCLTNKNEIVLLDWKTTTNGLTLADLKNSKQLKMYAWLLKTEHKINVDWLAYGVINKTTDETIVLKIRNKFDLIFHLWLGYTWLKGNLSND